MPMTSNASCFEKMLSYAKPRAAYSVQRPTETRAAVLYTLYSSMRRGVNLFEKGEGVCVSRKRRRKRHAGFLVNMFIHNSVLEVKSFGILRTSYLSARVGTQEQRKPLSRMDDEGQIQHRIELLLYDGSGDMIDGEYFQSSSSMGNWCRVPITIMIIIAKDHTLIIDSTC